jgi:AAA15 family ATPase/GTPase
LTHQTALGEAKFDFQEESEGTKNLIGFWLPWYVHTISSIISTLVVDELDSSLHPEIVALLVTKHIKSDSAAQLIFTTHDTHLMDTKLLRRDQFWLTERDANGATQLRSIHDFEGRESEDLEKRYYEGRYRGLPFVRKG